MTRVIKIYALGLVLAGVAGPAMAQTDGSTMRAILGTIGLVEPERDPIDYKPRPALVVPPAMKLQPPSAPASARNPNWPKDPDVQARAAADAEANKPATEREKYIQGQRPLLSQEELRRGRINAPAPNAPFPRSAMEETPYETMIQPIIIGRNIAAERNSKEDLRQLSREEPPRKYLSDPPVGMRRPAANAEMKLPANDDPAPMESRFGQQEFLADQARR